MSPSAETYLLCLDPCLCLPMHPVPGEQLPVSLFISNEPLRDRDTSTYLVLDCLSFLTLVAKIDSLSLGQKTTNFHRAYSD